MANKYYFTTKDLLLTALLCCLGGVTSTYVGYIGSTLGSLTGIPMAGQLISGLHIFWIVLVLAVVDKKGSGALAGLLKGFVEFIAGSHLGVLVLPTSLLEGIFAEIGFWPFKKYRTIAYVIAGGLGSWANLLVTNTLFNAFPGIQLFGTLSVFSFLSGMIFAGYMGLGIVRILEGAGMTKKPEGSKPSKIFSLPGVISVILVAFVIFLAIHYFTAAQVSPAATNSSAYNYMDPIPGGSPVINITGAVSKPGSYDIPAYEPQFITIAAKNNHAPDRLINYTGVPLCIVLKDAGIMDNATRMDITASDNYEQTFDVKIIMEDGTYILVPENGEVDLVAKNTTSHLWVRSIMRIKIY